ncbi:MAG: CD225/dispanin family protein [Oscillospiraceae bacterium]|nr:CD225/dispanin family protein [Oscillospiraceae bacterium]
MGYCERCGGKYDYEGICEICGEDEEWTYNYPHNRNKVKCKSCGHEIYEARRYCFICGTRNDSAFKKGDHYCPRCGVAFENDVCPSCGKSLSFFQLRDIGPNDTGYCPSCGKETSFKDHFCIHCGNENYKKRPVSSPSAKKKPIKTEPENPPVYAAETTDCMRTETKAKTQRDINTTLWLVLGIVSFVLCCMPTGIGTIIYSIHAKNCARIGNMARAGRKLRIAKIWFFVGAVIIAVLGISSVIIQVFG